MPDIGDFASAQYDSSNISAFVDGYFSKRGLYDDIYVYGTYLGNCDFYDMYGNLFIAEIQMGFYTMYSSTDM